MTLRLDASAADFGDRFTALLSMKRESSPDVDHTVRKIIEDVIARGDEALIDYSRQFDRIDLAKTGIAVSAAEIATAEAKCSREQLAALDLALGISSPQRLALVVSVLAARERDLNLGAGAREVDPRGHQRQAPLARRNSAGWPGLGWPGGDGFKTWGIHGSTSPQC